LSRKRTIGWVNVTSPKNVTSTRHRMGTEIAGIAPTGNTRAEAA
jgi:hypothetical protein